MKILTIVGARPQFIKAAAISRQIEKNYKSQITEIILHTGQHFDNNMSEIFFSDMNIPKPKINLKISGGNHGAMTAKMLEGIEKVILDEKPDYVLLYGDTNSTLAGSLAAVKLKVPIAHVEAGLRSYNMNMPEEVNRILTDRVAKLLFCPTNIAVNNLKKEGITEGVINSGDVMYDISLIFKEEAQKKSTIKRRLNLKTNEFILATCHRAENTDKKENLKEILNALENIAKNFTVIFPVHPRTKKLIEFYNLDSLTTNIVLIEPLSFFDTLALEQSAKMILTDSGGIQKEAFFYNTPCITLRDETEWIETIELGWNILAGANSKNILQAFNFFIDHHPFEKKYLPYGDGMASKIIIDTILIS